MKYNKELNRLALKALDNLLSVKATVFVVGCFFLWRDKIDQGAWIQVIGIVIGARTANEIVGMIKKRGSDD